MADVAPAVSTEPAVATKPATSLCICEGEKAFTFVRRGCEAKVPVTFSRPADADNWALLFESPKFRSWASQFEDHETFLLKAIKVESIALCEGGGIQSAFIHPHISTAEGEEVKNVEPVLLRGAGRVGVLVILRCSYGGNNAGQEARGRNWTRDYVLFSAVPRPAIAQQQHLEIMTGEFNEEGDFVSPAAAEMAAALNVRIHKQDLVFLTKDHCLTSSPEVLHETFDLYLYRQNVNDAELAILAKTSGAAATGASGAAATEEEQQTEVSPVQHLRLTSLGEAWKMTSDARSMAALFLFHEFRYHRLMPKYRPPRDSKTYDVEKRKPTFVTIDSLDPDVSGANLRVKIFVPPKQEEVAEVSRRDGKVREAKLVVGDQSAIINMKLEGDQLELPGVFAEGTCLVIRNARIEVVDTHMVLSVNKWGKVDIPQTDEDRADFEFAVNDANDKSGVEYELVHPDEAAGAQGMLPHDGMNGGGRRGGGRGRRGRGGGRGRGRGGRGGEL